MILATLSRVAGPVAVPIAVLAGAAAVWFWAAAGRLEAKNTRLVSDLDRAVEVNIRNRQAFEDAAEDWQTQMDLLRDRADQLAADRERLAAARERILAAPEEDDDAIGPILRDTLRDIDPGGVR